MSRLFGFNDSEYTISRFEPSVRRTNAMATRAAPTKARAALRRLTPAARSRHPMNMVRMGAMVSPRGAHGVPGARPGYRSTPSRVDSMFRHRERMVKILGVLLAAALVLSLVIPILGSTGP